MQKRLNFTTDSLKPVVEALIFVSDEPLSIERISEIVLGADPAVIKETVFNLTEDYEREGRGIQIIEVADGYKMCTRSEFSTWISELFTEKKKTRLSTQALESLAVIAYKQPITKAEIEEIRGVNIVGTLKTLLERNLIKILGKKEAPGRPIMYGTTREFLEYFGLKDLSALPTLKEFSELGLNEEITFPEPPEQPAGNDEASEDIIDGWDSVETESGGNDQRGEGDA